MFEKFRENPEQQMPPQGEGEPAELSSKSNTAKRLADKALGITRETNVPGTETKRGEAFRWERAQLLRQYELIQKLIPELVARGEDPRPLMEMLPRFQGEARHFERALDELNRQYHKNVTYFDVESSSIGKHHMPLVKLDLRSWDIENDISGTSKAGNNETEVADDRVPYFVVGGIDMTAHEIAVLANALALEGNKVYVSWYPESLPDCPPDWNERLKRDRTYGLHAEVVKETIRQAGLDKVNLIGYSMGGGISMEAATDKDFDRIHDLVILDPVSIEEKGVPKLSWDFFVRQGIGHTVYNSEELTKALYQGVGSKKINPTFITDGQIISHKHFDPEKLSQLNASGDIKVMSGTQSPIVNADRANAIFQEANTLRAQRDPEASHISIYNIEGGDHLWPLVHAMGLAHALKEPGNIDDNLITTLQAGELDNSGAKTILRNILKDK